MAQSAAWIHNPVSCSYAGGGVYARVHGTRPRIQGDDASQGALQRRHFRGAVSVLVVVSLFWVLGYNSTSYYPSVSDPASSLTIRNSSSSEFTLTVMSYVSLVIPFVLAYIVYVWRSMDRRPLTPEDVTKGHAY